MGASSASFMAQLATVATRLVSVERCAVGANRQASEIVWSHVLNDTICESAWLTSRDMLVHQYASGHQTLYVLYRILNENHPMRILCVGHGAMLQVVSQYAHSRKGVEVRHADYVNCSDSQFDLVCVEMDQSSVTLSWMKLSEHGTIIINDACRVLKNSDIGKYANFIHESGRSSVVGIYEGIGVCYVVTGKDRVYLVSM